MSVKTAFDEGKTRGLKAAAVKIAEEFGLDPAAVEKEILAAAAAEEAAGGEGGGEEGGEAPPPAEEAPPAE